MALFAEVGHFQGAGFEILHLAFLMESYKVSGLPNSGLQSSCTHPAHARGQNNGSYGLSIRVQGIDGHPYVVLNNQDRGLNPYAASSTSNGYNDSEGSFIDNFQEYDFRETREKSPDNPFAEYRAQHQVPHVNPYNDISESRDAQAKKPSTLLNFQKHPEILKPYDPERNALGTFHNISPQPFSATQNKNKYPGSLPRAISPGSKSSTLEQPKSTDPPTQDTKKRAQPHAPPQTFPAGVRSQKDLSKGQAQTQPQSQAKPQVQAQSSVKPQSQFQPLSTFQVPSQVSQHGQRFQVPQVSSTTSVPSEQSSCRTPSTTSSTNSSLERRHREPDILPLRRTDSSGPVLQSSRSRNSSVSSTTPTKEEQLEALYGDSINRHKNRRYIPFLPGTGRDIDTGSIQGVDELISKFDGKEGQQRRGRSGRRNRINPEDRKRSRSVDSALPFGLQGDTEYLDEVSRNRGRSTEHLLRPSQLLQKSPFSSVGRRTAYRDMARISSEPGSPQGAMPSVTDSILVYKKPLSRPSILPVENKTTDAKKITQNTKIVTSVATMSLSKTLPNCNKKTNEMVAEVSKISILSFHLTV